MTESGSDPLGVAQLPARQRPAYVSEFQPDAIEVEERAPPRVARLTLYLILLLILAAVTWASLTELDEIAIARGKLITAEPNIVVQPLESSLVRRIDVDVGQSVAAGQVLAVLDPTFTEADVDQLKVNFDTSDAMVNRLEAELSGRDYTPSDPANAEQSVQARLAAQRKLYHDSRLQNLTQEMTRARANIQRSQREEAIMQERLAGIREMEEMRASLFAGEAGSRLDLLEARDARLEIEADIARLQGEQVEATQQLEKARLERNEFEEDFRRTAFESLVEARERRNAAAEELKKAQLRRSQVTLTAPADAVVLEIAQRSVGSVVREAEPFFVLVPSKVPMEAEVLIEPMDIGQISRDQVARIKLDAFPFQKHGTVTGVVRTISEDSFADRDGGGASTGPGDNLFYRARLRLDKVDLRDVPTGFRLLPGMSIQAEIQLGRRRVISYFLYPLLRGLDESIRER